jgi:hypothetical protein
MCSFVLLWTLLFWEMLVVSEIRALFVRTFIFGRLYTLITLMRLYKLILDISWTLKVQIVIILLSLWRVGFWSQHDHCGWIFCTKYMYILWVWSHTFLIASSLGKSHLVWTLSKKWQIFSKAYTHKWQPLQIQWSLFHASHLLLCMLIFVVLVWFCLWKG